MAGWTPLEEQREQRHLLRFQQHLHPLTFAPLVRDEGVERHLGSRPLPRALTPGGIGVAPGRWVEVPRVRFEYQGPARQLMVGWALKPQTGLWGTDFNNGQNRIFSATAFSPILVVPSTPQWKWYDSEANLSLAFAFGFPMPDLGDHLLVGGGMGKVNEGGVDTWVWLTDMDAIIEAGLQWSAETLTQERFILALDTDAGVWSLSQAGVGVAARQLGLAYRVA